MKASTCKSIAVIVFGLAAGLVAWWIAARAIPRSRDQRSPQMGKGQEVRGKGVLTSVVRGSSAFAEQQATADKPSALTTPSLQHFITPLPVPPSVLPIFGLAGDGRLGTRLAALERLGKRMSAEEVTAMSDYLRQGIQNEKTLTPEQSHVLVNEILDALVEQETPPPGLTGVMIAVYRDRGQDPVVRDYTLQHLRRWYDRAPDPAQILPVFWEALAETDSTMAGTALLALHGLGETAPTDRQRLAEAALAIARDGQSGPAARVTALQVCSRLGVREALPLAQELAAHGKILPLRISAIATLGNLGGSEQLPLLEALASGSETRLLPAVRAALTRLKTRMGNES